MTAIRGLAIIMSLLAFGLSSSGAQAQSVPSLSTLENRLLISYWWTSVTASDGGGQFASWSTGMLAINYRFRNTESPWGFQVQYATGSQGSWSGTLSSALSGTDTIWSADAIYRREVYRAETQMLVLRGLVGYGSIKWETTLPTGTQRFTSAGLRVGFDALFPFQIKPDGSYWAITAMAVWYPSNSTSFLSGGVTSTSSGPATDWSIGVQYKSRSSLSPKVATSDGGYRLASLTTQGDGHDWTGAIEYQVLTAGGGSSYRWSGVRLTIGKTF